MFLVSLEMLFNKRRERKEDDANFDSDNISDNKSVFPLAIPQLAGPAAMISVVVSVSNIGGNYINQIIGISSSLLIMGITFVTFFIVSRNEKIVNSIFDHGEFVDNIAYICSCNAFCLI